jgi:Na+-transporting NADH:ubiquinone oxidoreductase subunit NqrE
MPGLRAIAVFVDSLVLPRYTGMCDALAISWRSASKLGAWRALMHQRGSKAIGALRAADIFQPSPAVRPGLT